MLHWMGSQHLSARVRICGSGWRKADRSFYHDPSHDDEMLDRLFDHAVAAFKCPFLASPGRRARPLSWVVPWSQTSAELLFEVFTSNLPFDELTSVFGSDG